MNLTDKQRKNIWICVSVIVALYIIRSYMISSQQAAYYQRQAIRAAQQRAKAAAKKAAQAQAPPAKPVPAPSKTDAAQQQPAPIQSPALPNAPPALPASPPVSTPAAAPSASPTPPTPLPAPPPRATPPINANHTEPPVLTPMPFATMPGVWWGQAALDKRGLCKFGVELRENEPLTFVAFAFFSCATTPILQSPKASPKAEVLNRGNADATRLTGKIEDGAIHLHADKTLGSDINGCTMTSLTLTPFGTKKVAAEWQEGECGPGYMILQKVRS